MSRFPILSAFFAGLTVALIVFYIWLQTSTRRWDTPEIVFCRDLYGEAKTRADSMRVDGETRPNQGKAQVSALNCGALRAAYPDLFARAVARP